MAAFCFTRQRSLFLEIALMFVRLDYLASGIVNANDSIM